MAIVFRAATKNQLKLRMALIGPAGSGKTYSALNIAQHLGKRIAVIDTEHGSASKYAGLFQFDVVEPESFHPQMYIDGIAAAEQAGYDVLIIDSLSHAWMGKDGALELVDRAAKRISSGNSFAAWRDVTPLHNKLIEAMLAAKLHLIVTMRSKMEYVQDKDDKGRTVIRKVGLQPVQRDGLEYEFDVVADMDTDNNFVVGKTRCPALAGAVVARPGKEVADTLMAWLTDGAPAQAAPAPKATPKAAEAPKPKQQKPEQPKTETVNVAESKPEPSTPASKPITEKQRRTLTKLAQDAKVSREDFSRYLSEVHGAASSAELNQEQYQDVKWWLVMGKSSIPFADIAEEQQTFVPFADPADPEEQQTFGDFTSI